MGARVPVARAVAPPRAVLRAFGVDAPARRLPGGQGTSWVAGDVVLKPVSGPVHDWVCEVTDRLQPHGVRVARPLRDGGGTWSRAGWSATRWVSGDVPDGPSSSTWVEVIEAGRAFHRAVAHLARPACLDLRDDWWALADRSTWGERELRMPSPFTDIVRRLHAALEPLGPPQVVHGDLTTNVLLAPGSAPTVIDVSPYWRPTAYAEGIVVADALCWHGAGPGLLASAGVSVPAVARALLFRVATTGERVRSTASGVDLWVETKRYSRATAAIGL